MQDGRMATHLQRGLLACEPEYAHLCAGCLEDSRTAAEGQAHGQIAQSAADR
jgi:hypothetical protein